MPWTAADAEGHTKKADTSGRRKLWAKVANRVLRAYEDAGDEFSGAEGHAIRAANAAVERTYKYPRG